MTTSDLEQDGKWDCENGVNMLPHLPKEATGAESQGHSSHEARHVHLAADAQEEPHDPVKLASHALRAHHEDLQQQLRLWSKLQEKLVGELLDSCILQIPAPAHDASRLISSASVTVMHDSSADNDTFTSRAGHTKGRRKSLRSSTTEATPNFTGWEAVIGQEELKETSEMVRETAKLLNLHQPHGLRPLWRAETKFGRVMAPLTTRLLKCWDDAVILRHSEEQPPQTRLAKLVRSKFFEMVSAVVIFSNALFAAFSVDYARKHLDEPSTILMDATEFSFCAFYTLELLLRVFYQKYAFFVSSDWCWNLFDVILVGVAINEQVGLLMGARKGTSNFVFLRAFRAVRLLKVLRLVRLFKSFVELRLIIRSILGSLRAMQWSLVLVFSLTYLAALLFMQAVTTWLADHPDAVPPDGIEEYWSTVAESMMSLYMGMTGGVDWQEIAEPLKQIGGPYFYLFLLYSAFYMWVLANTLTSLFVESTMRHSWSDQNQLAQDQMENREHYVQMLENWYRKLDKTATGYLAYEDFCEQLTDPSIRYFAALMDIELCDVKQLFGTLSNHGTRSVDLDTFVVGCIKLRGTARSVDLMNLVYSHRQTTLDQKRFAEYCQKQFSALRSRLPDCPPSPRTSSGPAKVQL